MKPGALLRNLIFKAWLWDARQKYARIRAFLPENARCVEIGAGSGSVTMVLRAAGFHVTPVDVKNWSLTQQVTPEIYDGRQLPYANQHFDTALLLTVLHHIRDQETVLREAARVARQIVIIEDVYEGRLQRWLTLAADSLFNLEFRGHPHSNRSDPAWRTLFAEMGLELRASERYPMLKIFRQQTYILHVND